MKSYSADEVVADSAAAEDIGRALKSGDIACVPCGGTYRLVCDALDGEAVMRLMALKRRSGHAPSLVFVNDEEGLQALADELPEALGTLAHELWPGELTILVRPSDAVPGKVQKQLTKANRHLGVRIPRSEAMRAVTRAFGGPLLASSANKANKAGASSGALVRKLFGGRIAAFVDAGELKPQPASTVVALEKGAVKIRRAGAVSDEQLRAALSTTR